MVRADTKLVLEVNKVPVVPCYASFYNLSIVKRRKNNHQYCVSSTRSKNLRVSDLKLSVGKKISLINNTEG